MESILHPVQPTLPPAPYLGGKRRLEVREMFAGFTIDPVKLRYSVRGSVGSETSEVLISGP